MRRTELFLVRAWYVLASLLVAIPATCLVGDDPSAAHEQVSHSKLAALRDVGFLTRSKWPAAATLIEIVSDPLSGSNFGTVIFDPKTGKVVEESVPGILRKGHWRELIDDDAHREGEYRWIDPLEGDVQLDGELDSLPFMCGGAVVCVLDAKASGREVFRDVRLLPEGTSWASGAKELVTDPSPIETIRTAIQAGRLNEVGRYKNPILALIVADRVILNEKFPLADKLALIEKSWDTHLEVRAAIAYVLATSASPDATDVMKALIGRVNTVEGLLPLYEGLWTACWYEFAHQKQSGTVRHEAIADIARELRDCAVRLGEHAAAERIAAIIDRLGR